MDAGGSVNLDVEHSIASLLGFKKENYSTGKCTLEIVDTMGINTIIMHCNIISGIKDNGKDSVYTIYI